MYAIQEESAVYNSCCMIASVLSVSRRELNPTSELAAMILGGNRKRFALGRAISYNITALCQPAGNAPPIIRKGVTRGVYLMILECLAVCATLYLAVICTFDTLYHVHNQK